ncbi:MAG: hypothetical protein J6N52_04065 [Clostridia bacterium]|nr:hypothetical protein [Clostridia bacterium]
MNNDRIKLMITIIKRGIGSRVVDFYRAMGLHYDFICLGMGTASSEILDYLGLEKTDKDIVISMVPQSQTALVLNGVCDKFRLKEPGGGIVFTIPLTSVSSRISEILCKTKNETESGGKALENEKDFELVLAIFNRGCEDLVMNAAKRAGARGGTMIHARRVGFEDVQNFFGFTIQPEKDIIAILAKRTARREIMEEIAKDAGISTDARAMLLSLPVDDIIGI